MKPLLWVVAALMLTSAVLLVTGVGAAGLWIAVIAVGVAFVAIDRLAPRRAPRH